MTNKEVTMGARKARMIRKARRLIEFGYKPTFREMMQSYRFWKRYCKNLMNNRMQLWK